MNEEKPKSNVLNFGAAKAQRDAEKAAEILKNDPTLRLPVADAFAHMDEYERKVEYRSLATKLIDELRGNSEAVNYMSYEPQVSMMGEAELAAALDSYAANPQHFIRGNGGGPSKARAIAEKARFLFSS